MNPRVVGPEGGPVKLLKKEKVMKAVKKRVERRAISWTKMG